jgi:hypothetical protein
MQRISLLFSLLVVCFLTAVQAQTTAPKPDPALEKLHVWVGHWTYEGEYQPGPLGPGGKVAGEYDGEMILGGFAFQGRWAEKGPAGETRGLEIYGYDPLNKNYPFSIYMDNGGIYSGAMSISENTFTLPGKFLAAGKVYEARITIINAADGMSLTLKGEISADGKTWATFSRRPSTPRSSPPRESRWYREGGEYNPDHKPKSQGGMTYEEVDFRWNVAVVPSTHAGDGAKSIRRHLESGSEHLSIPREAR